MRFCQGNHLVHCYSDELNVSLLLLIKVGHISHVIVWVFSDSWSENQKMEPFPNLAVAQLCGLKHAA